MRRSLAPEGVSRLNVAVAGIAVALSFLIPPMLYFTIAYTYLRSDIYGDARVAAEAVQPLVTELPLSWFAQKDRLDPLVARHYHFDTDEHRERLTVEDGSGRPVMMLGDAPLWPVASYAAPLRDSGGTRIGSVTIERSLRPLLITTGLMAVAGVLLAAVSFFALRVIPVRNLLHRNEALRRRDAELAFANTLLTAATEGSPDAILIVDSAGRFVSYNQNFVDLWRIPPDVLAARDDKRALDAVMANIRDADAFRTRVQYLYEHPDEESHDRVELTDARVLDRHTKTLHGPQGENLGRIWFFRDITEQERASQAVKESEALFRTIFDAAIDGISLADASTRQFFLANKSFCDMLGYAPQDITALSVDKIHPAESLPMVLETFARQSQRRMGLASALPVRRKDGSVFYADVNSAPVQIGGKTYMLGVFRDITARKAAEDQLRFANVLLQAQLDSAPDAVLVVQEDRAASYNRSFLSTFDIPPEVERLHDGDATLDATLPKLVDPMPFRQDVAHLRQHPEAVVRAREAQLKNGRVLEYNGATIRGPEGKSFGRIWFFRDVTERHNADEAVRKSEEKYRNLVESATDFLWEIDADNRYTYYSPSARTHLGYEPAELIGKTPFDIMPPGEAERVARAFAKIAAARQPFAMIENTVLAKDGSQIVMETSGVPIFDKAGVYCGYRGIERDVTERKLAEIELKERDTLLHAVATGTTELMTEASLDEAVPKALAMVGDALQIDRVLVMERAIQAEMPPALRYQWHSPEAHIVVDERTFKSPLLRSPQLLAMRVELSKGTPLTLYRSSVAEGYGAFLDALEIKSMLVVSVTVDGKYWGQLSFASCRAERPWRNYEIEILTTLGELIGSAIQRERYVNEIANANRIVQNTPTLLYRLRGVPPLPMIYISQNIHLFGYEPAALTESPTLYQKLIHPDDIAGVREQQVHAIEPNAGPGSNEFRLLTSRGDYRWVENRYTPIHDANGRLIEIEGLLIDITERKAAEDKIAQLARTDPLTGLANRTTFIERLRQLFAGAHRTSGAFALHYIDLDHFKDINDTLGHPTGDLFLTEIALRLKSVLRETDLAGRLGGDEFAVLQSDVADSADAGTLADKIRHRLAEPIRIDGNVLHGTVSIGIAIFSPGTASPEDLLAQADIALYRAKEEGRDQYRFHTAALDIQVREQVSLAEDIRAALNKGQFELHYQPQVELVTGRIVGMEALARWRHPTRGLLPAAVFIPVAERAGMVGEFGRWVLDRACAQMHAWRADGIAPATIAVNVSAAEIKSADEYLAAVRSTLARWQVSPEELELDVTESTLARATLAQNDVLERLQKLGINISIDDFGTKYSSLDYLRTYRVNRLKIPPALISHATHDADAASMVRAIIGIARELDIEVIAQGVENEKQWAFLSATPSATKVQGYFFSEPVPPERATALLRNRTIELPRNGNNE